jgi:O-antigen/teichoic acid export membrane protein
MEYVILRILVVKKRSTIRFVQAPNRGSGSGLCLPIAMNQKEPSLTRRALLTLVANVFVQLAQFLTGFFISPIIMRGLGTELFGAWGMIQQANGYFSTSDLRAPATMRFLLGLKQRDEDIAAKQRIVGALFIVWAFSLPLTILLGTILIWYEPQIVRVGPPHIVAVQIALMVLLANSILDRILSIPLHILRAQNLDYKGAGINTFTVLTGSLLSGLAVWLGWGLVGLAIATTVNILLVSLGRFWVARRAIPWLGAKKPRRDELVLFIKTSLWLFSAGLAGLLVYSTDTILVGLLLGPAASGVYVTTGVVMRMFGEPIYQIVSAGNAGLMDLCGQKEWDRVAQVRREMYFILLFFMTILGTGVIALNGPFLSLWAAPVFYGGASMTTIIVIAMVTQYLSRIDLLITDAMLFLRQKTWVFFAAGIIVVGGGASLLPNYGALGMAIALLAGNFILLSMAWYFIHRRMGKLGSGLLFELARPLTVMAACFGLAAYAQTWLTAQTWPQLFLNAAVVGSLTLVITLSLAMPAEIRASLLTRLITSLRIPANRP